MNVETVLTSESGESEARWLSLNPRTSFRRPPKRVSQDPPGVAIQLTPMEAAISELVPQDVAVMSRDSDPPDYASTESTLTGPPTINFLNQPTDEDFERENPDPYGGVPNQNDPPSRRPRRPPAREYDDDESSSLPEIPNTIPEDSEASDHEILNFINRAYSPDSSLQLSDRVDEQEEGESFLQQSDSLSPDISRKDKSSRTSKKSSQPSNAMATPSRTKKKAKPNPGRQRPQKVLDDEEDSDLTPRMKSPYTSSKTKTKGKDPQTPSKRSVRKSRNHPSPLLDDDDNSPNSDAAVHRKKKSRDPSKQKPAASPKRIKSPTSVLEEPHHTNTPSTKPKKPDRDSYFSDDSSSYQYYGKPRGSTHSGRKQKDRNALLGIDDDDDSDTSSFGKVLRRPTRIFGRREDEDKHSQLLGYDDTEKDDDGSSLGLSPYESSESNRRGGRVEPNPLLEDGSVSDSNRGGRGGPATTTRRPNPLLEDGSVSESNRGGSVTANRRPNNPLLDDSSVSESNRGGRGGSEAANRRPNNPLKYDSSESNRGGGRRGAPTTTTTARRQNPRLDDTTSIIGESNRRPLVKSFSQIPIHPNMTPEEWKMAQEQIHFLEQELDKVSELCQELTEAAAATAAKEDEEDASTSSRAPPPDGNWTKAQQQVKYLEGELETVQELCNLLTATAKESTDTIVGLEVEQERLLELIRRLQRSLQKSKSRMEQQEKALDNLVHENESRCCSLCWDWISEPIVWFVSYLYRID